MRITIHEFSTGINFTSLDNNGWVSKGFTGSYMNITLAQIPKNIEKAISNNLFKVSESKSTSEPAIIGRVVRGDQDNPDYSVIAIVSKGKDDQGRYPSFYRYFVCEGSDSLWKIIDYLDQFKNKNLPLPSFNPLHTRNVGPGITYDLTEEKPIFDMENDYPQDTVPILIEEKLHYKVLNLLAEYKAQEHNLPISWAYNVEALEDPQQFIIINPASAKAYQGIKEEITRKASQLIIYNPDFDAQGLKSAIRGLINNPQIKPEWLEAIKQSLASEEITEKYWEGLFNDEGAKRAIEDKITSPQMARLLTLRAIILPKVFPDFWVWYSTNKNIQQESLDLQNKLKQFIRTSPQLREKLLKDVKQFIHSSLNKKNKLDSFADFLFNQKCAWGTVIKSLEEEIEQDFNKISHNAKNLNCDFNKALLNSSLSKPDLKRYQDLALFLEKLKIYKPAAYYYQVSTDKVPISLYEKIFSKKSLKADYGGIMLYREITPVERMGNFLKKNQLIILLGIGVIIWAGIGLLAGKQWGQGLGLKQGRLTGQKEVCKKLEEKQKEIADLKQPIQLDLCQAFKEKIEPPKSKPASTK